MRHAVGDRSRQPGERARHTSGTVIVPRIMGSIRRLRPAETRDVEFLHTDTDRPGCRDRPPRAGAGKWPRGPSARTAQRTSMMSSSAATSTSIEANSGVSYRTSAAREQLPTLSQIMVGPCGSHRRRAAKVLVPLWFACRLPAQITLDPYPLYLASVLGKPGTTRSRCDKPARRGDVLGSLLIALLAMPELNLTTLEWVGMFALPLWLFPIPKPSRSVPSDPSPIEREDDGARPEVGWVPLEMDERPIPWVHETVH